MYAYTNQLAYTSLFASTDIYRNQLLLNPLGSGKRNAKLIYMATEKAEETLNYATSKCVLA
jgi:hypothetical protein